MLIAPLSEYRQFLPIIAQWLHADWGELPPWTDLKTLMRRLEIGCGDEPFPRVFVAVSDQGELLGTASVKRNEMANHPDMTHWLGEVYVPLVLRGRGVGTRLIEATTAYAFQAGASSLFLYTPDQQDLYARRGWVCVGSEVVHNESVTIMKRLL